MALGNQCDSVYDVGNIDGPNHSLEELQESLTSDPAHVPLGDPTHCPRGGHELLLSATIWSIQFRKRWTTGCDQSDAHFDLRPYYQTGPNSGTGFRQMADHAKRKRSDFPTSS